jgi:putative flippase GtrA
MTIPAGLLRQFTRFAIVGAAGVVAYVVIFAALRTVTGAQVANFGAMLVTAVGNTAANRRLTFGVTGRQDAGRHHAQGLVVFMIGWAVTSGSLALLPAHAGTVTEAIVLVSANLTATALRFVLMRSWVFAAPLQVAVPTAAAPNETENRMHQMVTLR